MILGRLQIAKETGLISEERVGETLRFIHLTFCEFLAAVEAIQGQKDGWGTLLRAHMEFQRDSNPQTHSRLLEVIPFTSGLATRIRRPVLIDDVARVNNLGLLARCFLETKSYEHEAWPIFVSGMEDRLINTPDGQWNEEALNDLHLFNVVIRDQQQCALYSPGVTPIDAREFFRGLVAQQQHNLKTLINAFAFQDAAAAFRLADACGLDLLKTLPQVVVTSCDQPPFLELVFAKALEDEKTAREWAVALTEAALRSRLVARTLHEMPEREQLGRLVRSLPRRHRWDLGRFKSAYTQLVSLAVSDGEIWGFPALHVMRSVSTRLLPFAAYRGLLVSLPSLVMAAGLIDAVVARNSRPAVLPHAIGLVAFTAVSYFGMFCLVVNRAFYDSVLNIARPAPRDSIDRAYVPLVIRFILAPEFSIWYRWGGKQRSRTMSSLRDLRGENTQIELILRG